MQAQTEPKLGDCWTELDKATAALLSAVQSEADAHREYNHAQTRTLNARTDFAKARDGFFGALAKLVGEVKT